MSTLNKDAGTPVISIDPLDLGPYWIQRMPSPNRFVLDVDSNSPAQGTAVIGYTLNASPSVNQQWVFDPAPPELPDLAPDLRTPI
ncbi:hypothetical protein [Variovorax sp.]|uniref:RICIN domain-containing protein n=1 Tax=Variovorax sp. TaxID=1871043 RepID=UPI00137E9F85|nr:hypothetical protein [Variovorax sp.]KAF1061402.1 MAG: hypothetical protein GAK39_05720 [Variovorax sp.]